MYKNKTKMCGVDLCSVIKITHTQHWKYRKPRNGSSSSLCFYFEIDFYFHWHYMGITHITKIQLLLFIFIRDTLQNQISSA